MKLEKEQTTFFQGWIGLQAKTLNILQTTWVYPIGRFCDIHTLTHAHTQGLPFIPVQHWL
jgi:hypothetical protein